MEFQHYIGIDWSMNNVAIARHTLKSKKATVTEFDDSNIYNVKRYLKQLKGTKIVSLEESTASQWLYTELKPHCDDLIVCNPYYNHLLKYGPKNDRVDAEKIALLLRIGHLRPVYHSGEDFIYLRKLTSGYEDLIKATVRSKNQLSLLHRAFNNTELDESSTFVAEGLERTIELYSKEKDRYLERFQSIRDKYPQIALLEGVPGIGMINAVKAMATIVDIKRFSSSAHFISYCGLLRHELISGGKSYGRRKPRANTTMKSIFKQATMVNIIKGDLKSPFSRYYNYLIKEKNYPEFKARHATARKIAKIVYGVLKNEKKVDLRNMH